MALEYGSLGYGKGLCSTLDTFVLDAENGGQGSECDIHLRSK